MDYTIAIALVFGAPLRWRLLVSSSTGVGAELSIGRQSTALNLLKLFSRARHCVPESTMVPEFGCFSWPAIVARISRAVRITAESRLRSSCLGRKHPQ